MTDAKRKSALERIVTLTRRNTVLNDYIKAIGGENAVNELKNIIAENEKTIQELIKITDKRYEFLFNFVGGGWNSEWAYTLEEAQEMARKTYADSPNCVPDMKTFRVSSPADYSNLLSLFY